MKKLSLGLLALGLIAAAPPAQQAPAVEVAIGKSGAPGAAVDTASSFGADVGQVAGWTRVTGMAAGSKITHQWIHGADTSKDEPHVARHAAPSHNRKEIAPRARDGLR